MPINTTGLIVNDIASPAVSIDVSLSNTDPLSTLTVQLEVFVVFGTLGPKIPVAHQLFTLPPLTTNIRTFNITGALAYEVQADLTGAAFAINVFSKDKNNTLIAAHRVLDRETSPLTALTPVP